MATNQKILFSMFQEKKFSMSFNLANKIQNGLLAAILNVFSHYLGDLT